jgi:hypothetical protein
MKEVLQLANKAWYNPVRPSKRAKSQIDFFVLVNDTKGKNLVHHINVYQGGYSTNPHIMKECGIFQQLRRLLVM